MASTNNDNVNIDEQLKSFWIPHNQRVKEFEETLKSLDDRFATNLVTYEERFEKTGQRYEDRDRQMQELFRTIFLQAQAARAATFQRDSAAWEAEVLQIRDMTETFSKEIGQLIEEGYIRAQSQADALFQLLRAKQQSKLDKLERDHWSRFQAAVDLALGTIKEITVKGNYTSLIIDQLERSETLPSPTSRPGAFPEPQQTDSDSQSTKHDNDQAHPLPQSGQLSNIQPQPAEETPPDDPNPTSSKEMTVLRLLIDSEKVTSFDLNSTSNGPEWRKKWREEQLIESEYAKMVEAGTSFSCVTPQLDWQSQREGEIIDKTPMAVTSTSDPHLPDLDRAEHRFNEDELWRDGKLDWMSATFKDHMDSHQKRFETLLSSWKGRLSSLGGVNSFEACTEWARLTFDQEICSYKTRLTLLIDQTERMLLMLRQRQESKHSTLQDKVEAHMINLFSLLSEERIQRLNALEAKESEVLAKHWPDPWLGCGFSNSWCLYRGAYDGITGWTCSTSCTPKKLPPAITFITVDGCLYESMFTCRAFEACSIGKAFVQDAYLYQKDENEMAEPRSAPSTENASLSSRTLDEFRSNDAKRQITFHKAQETRQEIAMRRESEQVRRFDDTLSWWIQSATDREAAHRRAFLEEEERRGKVFEETRAELNSAISSQFTSLNARSCEEIRNWDKNMREQVHKLLEIFEKEVEDDVEVDTEAICCWLDETLYDWKVTDCRAT